jgi:hypothetical protein
MGFRKFQPLIIHKCTLEILLKLNQEVICLTFSSLDSLPAQVFILHLRRKKMHSLLVSSPIAKIFILGAIAGYNWAKELDL